MGRPPSPTGEIMGNHLTEALAKLTEAQKAVEEPFTRKLTDPLDWAMHNGIALQHLRELRHELIEIIEIYDANKRRGNNES